MIEFVVMEEKDNGNTLNQLFFKKTRQLCFPGKIGET